jgi:antitoxin MazE
VIVAGTRHFEVSRDQRRQAALARLKALKFKLPGGFKFSRDEANER